MTKSSNKYKNRKKLQAEDKPVIPVKEEEILKIQSAPETTPIEKGLASNISEAKDKQKYKLTVSDIIQIIAVLINLGLLWYGVKTVQQVQTSFEIQNRPFMQLRDLKIDSLHPEVPVRITSNLEVLGGYPIKYTKGNAMVKYSSVAPTEEEQKNVMDSLLDYNTYMPANGFKEGHTYYDAQDTLGWDRWARIIANDITIWYFVFCEYEDLATQKIRTYKAIVRFQALDGYRFVVSENGFKKP